MRFAVVILAATVVLSACSERVQSAQATLAQAPAAQAPNIKVWLNSSSGVYHCPGTRWYGATKEGRYLDEKIAIDSGYHVSGDASCGSRPAAVKAAAIIEAADAGKVWVNDSSHVYHCPGTQWYGSTVRGEFMTESNAQKAGHRPANGRKCS